MAMIPTMRPATGTTSASVDPRVVWLTLAAFIVAFARGVPHLFEPFGEGWASVLDTRFAGNFIRNWDRYGFFALGGRPLHAFSPVYDIAADGYVGHPPTVYWLTYGLTRLFGVSEWSIRLLPTLFAAGSAALTALLVGRRAGLAAGTAAALLVTVDEMHYVFGSMASCESPVLFFMLLAWVCRDADRPKLTAAAAFAAVLCDWSGAFLLPALLIYERATPRSDRRYRPIVAAAIGVGTALALILGLLAFWKGGLGSALSALWRAANDNDAMGATERADWPASQVRMFVDGHGKAFAIAAAGAVVLAIALMRRSDLARLAVALIVPGALNVLLFPARAYDHDYWWFYATPGAAAAIALAVHLIRKQTTVIVSCSTAAAIVVAAAVNLGSAIIETPAATAPETIAAVNRVYDRRTIVLFPDPTPAISYYAVPWIHPLPTSAADLERLVANFRSGAMPIDRVVAYVPPWLDAGAKESAVRALEKKGGVSRNIGTTDVIEFAR